MMAVLLAVAVGLVLADASVVVLALPDIYAELGATVVEVSWVITAYAAAVAIVAAAAGRVARRRPLAVTLAGLALFALASALCAGADTLGGLVAARVAQGVGGALLLVGSVGVLRALHPRGRQLWALAGTVGLAAGPALGGALTQAFDWRAIFSLQAPVSALAVLVVLDRRARAAPPLTAAAAGGPGVAANVALVLVSGALVGALFLSVLLIVEVWQLTPIRGALVVSALAGGTLVATPLRVPATTGCLLLAAGLAALALLPASSAAWAMPALAVCGAGLAIASRSLDTAAGDTALAVSSRHLGLVLGLVVLAPLLTASLERGSEDAALAGTATLLDSRAAVRDKVDAAFAVRDVVERTPRGRMPDLARFRDLRAVVRDTLTRAFRPTFAVAAALALAAAVPTAMAARGGGGSGRELPIAAVLVVLAVALVGSELAAGANGFGSRPTRDPCRTSADPYPGRGLDATVQRIVLGGLDGAACELGVSREELVLSLDRDTELVRIDWDRARIEAAVEAGLVRAVDDAEERGSLPGWAATVLRELAERAPIELALGAADQLRDLSDLAGDVRDEIGELLDRLDSG